jgi:hypothetical protein
MQTGNSSIIISRNVSAYSAVTGDLYDDIVDYLVSHNPSTIYHHPLWLQIISEETGQPYYYLIFKDDEGKIRGLIPFLFTRGLPFLKSPLSCKRISSLPRTPFAGLLADNDEISTSLLNGAKLFSGNFPGFLLQIKSTSCYSNRDNDYVSAPWRNTYIKQIPSKDSRLMFNSKKDEQDIIRGVKRAVSNKVFLKKGDSVEELKSWYKLYLIVMRQNRIPPRRFAFFRSIWELLAPAGLLDINLAYITENGKEVLISGNINYRFNKKYYGGFKAGSRKYSAFMGGDYILYNEFLELQADEYLSYDLGEVSEDNKTLDKYKRKWGVDKLQIYHNYYGEFDSSGLNEFDLRPGSGIITKLWQRLPLKVTAHLGGAVNNFL